MKTEGIHHVTAISGDIQRNLDFYCGFMGLRLVKRTVIQEEPTTYHLFYGDAIGTVGTDITFFDWPHVGNGRTGSRTVVRTDYTVADAEAIAWWRQRLSEAAIPFASGQDFGGRPTLHFADPDGQQLGIVAAGPFRAYRHWEANNVSPQNALQAIHSVTLGVDQLDATVEYLTTVFGYEVVKSFASANENEGEAILLSVTDKGDTGGSIESGSIEGNSIKSNNVGKELVVVERTERQPGLRGIGSIHHVALTIDPDDTIEAWHDRLVATGLKVTEIMRRYYFDSVYVRIPGGILFELATATGPGLTADEPVERLGQQLTLPPFLEKQRAEIVAKLKPLHER